MAIIVHRKQIRSSVSLMIIRRRWFFGIVAAFQRHALGGTAEVFSDTISAPRTPIERLLLAGLTAEAVAHGVRTVSICYSRSALVDRALSLIESSYSDPLKYGHIGRALGCDPEHLESLFRRDTGESLHQHLRKIRVLKAVELVREGHKVEAVAYEVGFRSKSAFLRAFRDVLGSTPSQVVDGWRGNRTTQRR